MCRLTCVRQTATPLQIAPYILYIIFNLFIAFSEVKRTNSHTTTPARSDHHCNLLHMPFPWLHSLIQQLRLQEVPMGCWFFALLHQAPGFQELLIVHCVLIAHS